MGGLGEEGGREEDVSDLMALYRAANHRLLVRDLGALQRVLHRVPGHWVRERGVPHPPVRGNRRDDAGVPLAPGHRAPVPDLKTADGFGATENLATRGRGSGCRRGCPPTVAEPSREACLAPVVCPVGAKRAAPASTAD